MAESSTDTLTNSPIALISTDFDGTLVGAGAETPGLAEFIEFIVQLREQCQVHWVINTGRDWDSLCMELLRRNFPVLPDWVVLVEREVHKICQEHPVGDYEWNQQCEEVHAKLFGEVTDFWKELTKYITSETGAELMREECSPVTIRARNTHEANRIHQFISQRLPSHPHLVVMRNSVYFRFAHDAYHKGSALQRIQKHLKIGADQTMSIGDHYNDIPMLMPEYARFIACPSNAIPEVQTHVLKQGGTVATLPEVKGVLEVWKNFLTSAHE